MEFIDEGLLLGERCKVTSDENMNSVLSKFVRNKMCGDKDTFTGYVNALTGDLLSGKRLYIDSREVYEGSFQNGFRHGPGAVCTKLDGTGKFLGSFANDEYESGTFITSEYTFSGCFYNGKFEGNGTLIHSNGIIYQGVFRSGLYDGKGSLTLPCGQKYVGCFRDGKKHGYGVLTEDSASVVLYEGDWNQDMRDGIGKDLEGYEGEFYRDQRHGKGSFHANNKLVKLIGPWRDGKPLDGPGWSIIYTKSGVEYVGEAVKLRPHGIGSLKCQNSDTGEQFTYEGELLCGIRHGSGRFMARNQRPNNVATFWRGDLAYSTLPVGADDETVKTENLLVLLDSAVKEDSDCDSRCTLEKEASGLAENDTDPTPSLSSCSDALSSETSFSGNEKETDPIEREGDIKVYRNGDTFQGYVDPFGKKHGFGIYTWASTGSVYSGQWKNSKKHGRGTLSHPLTGIQYIGNFVEDVIEGQGSMRLPDGSKFTGEFHNGIFHGEGVFMDTTNRTTFKGQFIKGMTMGEGEEQYDDGHVYKGEFQNGKRSGKGSLYKRGANDEDSSLVLIYEGEWDNDCITGEGKRFNLETPCPGSYEGAFAIGKRSGHGTFTARNGYILEGQWEYDLPVDGDWVITCPNGSVYYGTATCNNAQGIPVANGFGTHNEANGDFYSGCFREGKRHGSGLCVFSSGEQWDGKWEDGNFVKYGRPRP